MPSSHVQVAVSCLHSVDSSCPQSAAGLNGAGFTRKLLRALTTRKQDFLPFCKGRRSVREQCASGCFAFAAKRQGRRDPFRDDRKKSMLKFVQDVQPIIVEQFAEHTPAQ
ncbi:hypothetical protein WJX84_007527, partial [Apatococcus fuscideae]